MKKIAFVFLLLVLALATMGAAFAHWQQILYVIEEVNTGTLCVGIRDNGTDDEGPGYGDPTGTIDPGNGKNVGSAESYNVGDIKCTHFDDDLATPDDFYHAVLEVLDNVYPSYRATIELEVANCGTIPVKISWSTELLDGDPAVAGCLKIEFWEAFLDGVSIGTGTSAGSLETFMNGFQLHPCQRLKLVFTKHIMQEVQDGPLAGTLCPEGASAVLEHTVTAIQWNMY